jgi:hypothetical protein
MFAAQVQAVVSEVFDVGVILIWKACYKYWAPMAQVL